MTRDEVLIAICEAVDAKPPLNGAEDLSSFRSWDSLAVIEIIAMADEKWGITLDPKKLLACKTVDDLAALVH